MSSQPFPADPYRSPPEVYADPVLRRRPGGLTAICIIAMVLGGLGLITGLINFGALVAGKQFAQSMNAQNAKSMTPEQAVVQEEMQAEANAIGDQFFIANGVQAFVHFVVASLLIVGGVLTLLLKPGGRRLLVAVCVLAIIYEAGRTVVTTMVQMRTMSVMETYFPRMIAAGPQRPGAAPPAEAMKLGMKIVMVIGMVFTSIFMLVKVVFYLITLYYLNRQNIKPLFAEPILAT